EADQATIKDSWQPMEINGAQCPVHLVTEYQEVRQFVDRMPTLLRKRREREIMNRKKMLNSRPIKLAGAEFSSVEHLKSCLKEVLRQLPAGHQVNAKTSEVVSIGA